MTNNYTYAFRFPKTNSSLEKEYIEQGYQQQNNIITNNKLINIKKDILFFKEGDYKLSTKNIFFQKIKLK